MNAIKKNLVDLFELDKLPPEKSAEMLGRLSKLIFQSVLIRALPLLSEEDFTEYEKIVDANEGGDVLLKFLGEKVPDFENIILEEAETLRMEISEDFKSAGI
ncbi:MAG: hypothetical protein KBD52_03535 [Candidatus Pacebacteria bacterium]|nr:hypothetical protein [Candidatus Paceibacterota bacterium]